MYPGQMVAGSAQPDSENLNVERNFEMPVLNKN